MSNDSRQQTPKHRRDGRASTRGTGLPGRRVRLPAGAPCTCPPGFHEYGVHAPGFAAPIADLPPRPGSYPVQDVARMSASAVELLVHRATQETHAERAPTLPHLLITRDTISGAIRYDGPFPTGLEALVVARRLVRQKREQRPDRAFTLTVAPLLPH